MGSHNLKHKTIQTEISYNVKFFNAGVRKYTEIFRLPHFIENIIQTLSYSASLKDAWILIGGDGRTYSKEMIERAVHILAGNAVRKILVAENGWMPSFAVASVLKDRHCHFGFVFTGGHHCPGEDGYFGLKMLSAPGIPVREEITDRANRMIKSLQSYSTCEKLAFSFDTLGETENIISGKRFSIEVIDVVSPYVEATKMMFDFPAIKEYIRSDFKLLISCSNGVTGSIVKRIFVEKLGVPEQRILNSTPLEDFGRLPSDPNPFTYKDYVAQLQEKEYQFSAVINPDGSRCMIIGEGGFVVSPSDSLAIIAAHYKSIPLFQENKLDTVVRSICTSQAVDRVADSLSLLRLEVPVGWHNFISAMLPAKGKSTLFGEESGALGASSDSYCSDRDAVWTILAWLSILSVSKKNVKTVVEEHWNKFGRSFFGRLDFHISNQSLDMFLCFFKEKNSLRFKKIKSEDFAGIEYLDPFGVDPRLQTEEAKKHNVEIVFDIENYVYPYGFIKKSLLKDDQYQVYQIHLMEDARLVLRRSDSTTNSSTLRFYIEYRVEPGNGEIFARREMVLQPFINAAMKITKIEDFISSDITPIFI